MRRVLIVLAVLALAGAAAWWWWLGGMERVTAARVESALIANGLPQPMAACMGRRMAERLTIAQLRKLERLAPEDGEAALPDSANDLLARLRRVDDPEAVQVTVTAAAWCAFG